MKEHYIKLGKQYVRLEGPETSSMIVEIGKGIIWIVTVVLFVVGMFCLRG